MHISGVIQGRIAWGVVLVVVLCLGSGCQNSLAVPQVLAGDESARADLGIYQGVLAGLTAEGYPTLGDAKSCREAEEIPYRAFLL